ncbi:HD domain-containing protein [Streptomyces sp. NPDC127114]|uniref:HD domain-containing protein n=1 Tax=Streptomyces sp. NPDC127114 TaxID=3345366 RepID=UPI00362A9DB1
MPAAAILSLALDDLDAPPLRPLPGPVAELLARLAAPPRLVAHLRAVHDVAVRLVDELTQRFPDLEVDRQAVLFGAATHDIGKVRHRAELSGPGSAHEPAGRDLLLAEGVAPGLARFAATHAAWGGPEIRIEDLLVSLADKVWKNRRVRELEDPVVARLATGGREQWEVFLEVDDVLGEIGAGADARLAFQGAYPVV